MNQQNNVPIPVLFSKDGSIVIVGGTSGSARILDSGSCETLQVLPHDGQIPHSLFPPYYQLICPTGDTIRAIVCLLNQSVLFCLLLLGLVHNPRWDSNHSGWGFWARF